MKKVVGILLCFVVIMSSGAMAFANEEESILKELGTDPQQLRVSTSDELQIINENNNIVTTPQNSAALYWKFKKASETVDRTSAALIKASADATGPCTITVTISKTVNASFSVNLSNDQKSLIKASASASIGSSLSNSLGYAMQVESGRKGYIAYQPYLVVVKGTLEQYNSLYPNVVLSTISTTAKYPKKLANGFLDGWYYVKYY